VTPKVAVKYGASRERLRHLAIVFKFELRLKIVAELYTRPMSPKGFLEEFGEGSLERVSQHFAVLEKHGWLRRVGPKSREGNRRGPPETLYRATDTVYLDVETSALLPHSARLAWSWGAFASIARLLRQGIEGALFEGHPSRPLTCVPLEVDDIGWTQVIARLATTFEMIFEEEGDAKIRCSSSGKPLARAGILQVGFESPRSEDLLAPRLADGGSAPSLPLTERLAPLLADDLSMQILTELNRSDMSVKQFHREVARDDASEGAVRYRFDRLKELAWITVVDQVKKRATYEKVYRATKPPVTVSGPWAGAPAALRKAEVWRAFVRFSDLVKESIVAGTFDVRVDRHLSWSIVYLDREGWKKIVGNLERLAAFVSEEEERSKARIAAGAKPLTMVVALAAIESRSGPYKAP
jgi:hypothetical protein